MSYLVVEILNSLFFNYVLQLWQNFALFEVFYEIYLTYMGRIAKTSQDNINMPLLNKGFETMSDLRKTFIDKANELKTSDDRLRDLEAILRDPEFKIVANDPDEAEFVLNAAFGELKDSAEIWKGLMSFIQKDVAYTMAEDIMADKRGIGPFLQSQMRRLDGQDKDDFTAFLTMSKAGKKALENPRVSAMLMDGQSHDPMMALLLAMSDR